MWIKVTDTSGDQQLINLNQAIMIFKEYSEKANKHIIRFSLKGNYYSIVIPYSEEIWQQIRYLILPTDIN
jgi:hypothetical protein